jgi:hypothetical protein
MNTDLHRRSIAAVQALQSIKVGRRKQYSDWLVVGAAYLDARNEAMRVANTNRPVGKGYVMVCGAWLSKYPALADIHKSVRGHLLNIMENLDAVQTWRSQQDDPDVLNDPTNVWRKYTRSLKTPKPSPEPKKAQAPDPKSDLPNKVKINGQDVDVGSFSPAARGKLAAALNGADEEQTDDGEKSGPGDHEYDAALAAYQEAWTTHCLPLLQPIFDRCDDKYWTADMAWGDVVAWTRDQGGELPPTPPRPDTRATEEPVESDADAEPAVESDTLVFDRADPEQFGGEENATYINNTIAKLCAALSEDHTPIQFGLMALIQMTVLRQFSKVRVVRPRPFSNAAFARRSPALSWTYFVISRYVTGGVFPKACATYCGVSVRTKGMGSLGREPYRRRKPLISPLSLIRLNCSDIG